MINMSEALRSSPDIPLKAKLDVLFMPEIYIAENVTDFLDNLNEIDYPWYKDFPFGFDKDEARAFFIFHEVKLTSICFPNTDTKSGFYYIQDETDELVAEWSEDRIIYPPSDTFTSVEKNEGLVDGDWVHTVVVLYLQKLKMPLVVEVQKFKPRPRAPDSKKSSVSEILTDLFPQPVPSS